MAETGELQGIVDEAAADITLAALEVVAMFAALERSGLPPSGEPPEWWDPVTGERTPMTECYCWSRDSEMFGVARCFSGLRGAYCEREAPTDG